MSKMTRSEFQKAMNQVTNFVVSVRLKRCDDDVRLYRGDNDGRSRKRNARKIYNHLNFDEDEAFELSWNLDRESRWKRRRLLRSSMLEEKKYFQTYREKRKYHRRKPRVASAVTRPKTAANENAAADKLEETGPQKNTAVVAESKIGKIRVKNAAELGSTIIFVDEYDPNLPAVKNVPSDKAPAEMTTPADSKEGHTSSSKLNIQLISKLYQKFFTTENQNRIRKVVEILQFLSDNIDRKNEKLNEINNSRSTDAEKLMLRHQVHSEFNRHRELKQAALKAEFENLKNVFDNEHFEILFQLFFLGVLKMVIISESNKKGVIFKKIVNLLSQSLNSSNYKDERVFHALKSKTFRSDCLSLVQFIEKYCETSYFEMIFLSESDKLKMLSKKDENRTELRSVECENKNESVISRPSVICFSSHLDTVSCGSNLLLSQSDPVQTETSKKNEIQTEFTGARIVNKIHELPHFRPFSVSKQSNPVSCGSNLQLPQNVQTNPVFSNVQSVIAASGNRLGVVDIRCVNPSGSSNESSSSRPVAANYLRNAVPCENNVYLQQCGNAKSVPTAPVPCNTELTSILRREITKTTTNKRTTANKGAARTKPKTDVINKPNNLTILNNNSQNFSTQSTPSRMPLTSSATHLSSTVESSQISSSLSNIPASSNVSVCPTIPVSSLNKIHLNNRVLLGQQLLSKLKNSASTIITPIANTQMLNSGEIRSTLPSTSSNMLLLNCMNKPVFSVPVSNSGVRKSAPSSVSVTPSNTCPSIPVTNAASTNNVKVNIHYSCPVKPVTSAPPVNSANVQLSNSSLERPVTTLVTNIRLPLSDSCLVKSVRNLPTTDLSSPRPSIPISSTSPTNLTKAQMSDSEAAKLVSDAIPTSSISAQSPDPSPESTAASIPVSRRVNVQLPKSFLFGHVADVLSNNQLTVASDSDLFSNDDEEICYETFCESSDLPSLANEKVLTIVGELSALPLSCLQSVSQDLQSQSDNMSSPIAEFADENITVATATAHSTSTNCQDCVAAITNPESHPEPVIVTTKSDANVNSPLFTYLSNNNETVKPKSVIDINKLNRLYECLKYYKDSCCVNSTESHLRNLLSKNSYENSTVRK